MLTNAYQLFKNVGRTNANAWIHNIPIVDFGRVIKVVGMRTVVVEAAVQTSLSKETYTVTLLNLSSSLLEISDEPKVGDTVLLLFLRKHDPFMFMDETVNNPDATGYNRFSGVGVLMSTARRAAHMLVSCYDDDGTPVTDVKSDAEVYGTFNNTVVIEFCRAVFDGADERLISLVFGAGRPLAESHLARVEREYGFWKDPDGNLVALDAAVTERYGVYAPLTRDVQGARDTRFGLGTDKDGKHVETEAPVTETVHGKAPVTKDIRSPVTITVGIGNAESGDAEEQRDAPVKIKLGEKAGVVVDGKAGLEARFEKAVSIETGEKLTFKNTAESLGAVLSDFIQAVHDAITLGSPSTQTMNPATQAALQALKKRCEALMEK